MRSYLISAVISMLVLLVAETGASAERSLVRPFESESNRAPQNKIDKFVFANLKHLDIQPANVCSDAVFLRRVYLDCIGTLPTAEEARKFLSDKDSKKRRKLIDQLLQRKEFADYRAMKWSDLLRVKSEFPINLWPNAVQAYHRWIRTSIKENMPYDQFVREMLTASGSNFRVPQVNFYRAVRSREPKTIAQAVALTFMGTRAENWPEDRLAGMAAFFSHVGYKQTAEWKEEIVFFNAMKSPGEADSWEAVFPNGTQVQLSSSQDPREVFADWLIAPENPWFAQNITNRIWHQLLGHGIIHQPDDIRSDNRPSNPKLLAYLERKLVSSKYNLKQIYRLILNSKTYQLSSISKTDQPDAAAHFAYYPLRRLEAEVLVDAVCQITGTTEKYWSPIPEPFSFVPESERSIALADGSISSPFLNIFGRPSRDTGLVSERNDRPTAASRLHLLNSSHIRKKIEQGPKLRQLFRSKREPLEIATDLYLTILSRFPTEEELTIMNDYGQSDNVKRSEVFIDITWALINSTEFLYQH